MYVYGIYFGEIENCSLELVVDDGKICKTTTLSFKIWSRDVLNTRKMSRNVLKCVFLWFFMNNNFI